MRTTAINEDGRGDLNGVNLTPVGAVGGREFGSDGVGRIDSMPSHSSGEDSINLEDSKQFY